MDGFLFHITFKVLSIFKNNGIIAVGLPAHTSHVLQPLDVIICASLKEKFRQLLIRRIITTSKKQKNDIFIFCELLIISYNEFVKASNSCASFRRKGICNPEVNGVDATLLRPEDITSPTI